MLTVEGLQVRYGAITAVKGVSLEISEGELVALLGANGAGKTTTLLAISGALKAAAGRIVFGTEDITSVSPERIVHKGIAMVPETRDVFPDLTVAENLRLGAFIHRRDHSGFERDLKTAMDLFPVLETRADQAAGTLSGGEQQQLVIARALMSRPKLLLLDEPSVGLAPAIVERIFELINRLRERGLTILLVEQNAAQALKCADRVYVMSLGRVAVSGTAAEIASGSNLEEIYLGGQAARQRENHAR
ncbi:MAG: ABC transporter ATP-binding protein [Hyphomicrobiales bacterium]|nr:ABC transporter ATP-binding protein [Hyphomicrobiales bacterium]